MKKNDLKKKIFLRVNYVSGSYNTGVFPTLAPT